MPANYPGSAGATQAPASPPAAGSPPIVVLPVDGDADNAASVAQAFKVLADYAAFEQAPFANGSAWAQKIKTYRDAKLRARFAVDHWGKPKGAYHDWSEEWTPGTPFGQVGVTNAVIGRWNAVFNSGGSQSSSFPPAFAPGVPPYPASMTGYVSPNVTRQLALIVDGSTAGNRAEYRVTDDNVSSTFSDDALLGIEMDVNPFTVLDVNWVFGFTSQAELVNGIAHGAFFIRPSGAGGNWLCRTISGGSPTQVDSGVLASGGTPHHFEVVLVGASIDDNSVARALFYIDGAEVANITATLPINIGAQMIPVFGGTITGAVANQVILVSQVRYSQATALATP